MKDPAAARTHLARLRRLLDEEPGDPSAWREAIAGPTVELGRYPLAWA